MASWGLISTNDPNSEEGLQEIADRIQLAIQIQTAEINDHLRGGGYTLPLVVNESALSVVHLCEFHRRGGLRESRNDRLQP